MGRPIKSSQIGYDRTVQQQKSWAAQISQLPGDGQITERRIHTYRFGDVKEQCFGLGVCTVYRNSLQSTPRFTIYSTHKGHSQHAVHSSLTVMPLSYCLIESSLFRLLMLGHASLTAPPPHPKKSYYIIYLYILKFFGPLTRPHKFFKVAFF